MAKALLEFETLWLSQWKSRLSATKSALQATLLVLHPSTGVYLVNFDQNLLSTIEETKVFILFFTLLRF